MQLILEIIKESSFKDKFLFPPSLSISNKVPFVSKTFASGLPVASEIWLKIVLSMVYYFFIFVIFKSILQE